MARMKKAATSGFVLFNVLYEDGQQTSNRRVPSGLLGGLDGDEPARDVIEAEDRRIGQMSGIPRGAIKSIARAAKG